MSASVIPIGEAPPGSVEHYLRTNTNWFRDRDASAVRWKYFDEEFNRGRSRGLVWVRDDRVRGLVGIIPATMVRGDATAPLHWTCDWGVQDAKSTPGVGALLLKKAIGTFANAATIGGNANTKTLVPRMAAHTYEDGATYFWRPLRADALFHLGSSRYPILGRFTGTVLGRFPLPFPVRARVRARRFEGITPQLDSVLATIKPREWTARYDVHFLKWALERCPGLQSASCVVDDVAGAVIWQAESRTVRHVRFALWMQPGATDAALAVIADVISCARAWGGAILSTVSGRWDDELQALWKRAGLLRRKGPIPYFALAKTLDRLDGINYFAADLAQRFSRQAH